MSEDDGLKAELPPYDKAVGELKENGVYRTELTGAQLSRTLAEVVTNLVSRPKAEDTNSPRVEVLPPIIESPIIDSGSKVNGEVNVLKPLAIKVGISFGLGNGEAPDRIVAKDVKVRLPFGVDPVLKTVYHVNLEGAAKQKLADTNRAISEVWESRLAERGIRLEGPVGLHFTGDILSVTMRGEPIDAGTPAAPAEVAPPALATVELSAVDLKGHEEQSVVPEGPKDPVTLSSDLMNNPENRKWVDSLREKFRLTDDDGLVVDRAALPDGEDRMDRNALGKGDIFTSLLVAESNEGAVWVYRDGKLVRPEIYEKEQTEQPVLVATTSQAETNVDDTLPVAAATPPPIIPPVIPPLPPVGPGSSEPSGREDDSKGEKRKSKWRSTLISEGEVKSLPEGKLREALTAVAYALAFSK